MEEIVENKEGFKKTKLGWIPNDWETIRLENVVNIKSGNSPTKYAFVNCGLIPFIKVEDMNNCTKYQKESRFYVNENSSTVPKGSIIFPKRGAAILKNKVRIADLDLLMDSNMMSLTIINPEVNIEFLYYTIINEKLLKIADTSTIPQINNKHIIPYLIAIPKKSEQQKIAKILSTWDQSISETQKLIEQLKLRKKGLMQQLLTGKKRLPGFDGEWDTIKIGAIANHHSEKNENGENIIVLSCTKYDGLVPSLEYFGRQVYGNDTSKYKVVPRGYFAYATNHIEEGSIGLQTNFEKGLVSPMYTVFKTSEDVDDNFFFRYLKTDRMIYKYQSNMSGSINRRGGLRWNDFKTIEITIPKYKEQKAIDALFENTDKEIIIYEKKLSELQSQKKGLMQQLLTGQKRVKV